MTDTESGGFLCGSPLPCRGGAGGGVSIVIIHVRFRLFEKFTAKVEEKGDSYSIFRFTNGLQMICKPSLHAV